MQNENDVPISVSELNRLARLCLEKSLPLRWISGEVSNLTRASSGHWYFTLKDSLASVRCVMFRNRNQFVGWSVREGERVEVRAQASLYEARGDFQLSVEALRQTGQGSLFEAFLALKAKLDKEGLFAAHLKRPLPEQPHNIGIITSMQGAALHDALSTLNRRWPLANVIIYPCAVQGAQAVEQIVASLLTAGAHGLCDVLLLVRGGGSLEDLQAFNHETVARAIASCRIPIITGIGHETDFSIADFIADWRAPTPTGAAEAASSDQQAVVQKLAALGQSLAYLHLRRINDLAQGLDRCLRSLRHPADYLRLLHSQQQHLQLRVQSNQAETLFKARARWRAANYRLVQAIPLTSPLRLSLHHALARLRQTSTRALSQQQLGLGRTCSRLELLNPRSILSRGYALVTDREGGIVTKAQHLNHRDLIQVEFADGRISAEVILS